MLQTRIATTSEEKEAVYRQRYSIYVEEMGRYQGTADHEGRRLVDPEDDNSWIVYAADEDEVVASLRITWGGHGFSARQITQYGLAPFLAEIPAERLAVGERTMISPSRRGCDVFAVVSEHSACLQDEHGIDVVFGACEPHLLSFYCGIERDFAPKPYAPRNINSVESGYLVPIISFPHGPSALASLSPDGRLPGCVEQALTSNGTVTSPVLSDPIDYAVSVASEVLALNSSIFAGFDNAELAGCLATSSVIACAEGDRLLKKGGSARNVFVVLSGALEVSEDGHAVGVVLPGEVVGEMAYFLREPRRYDVDVLSDDTRVLSLSERTLRGLAADNPAVAAKLLENISRLLCQRLAHSGGR